MRLDASPPLAVGLQTFLAFDFGLKRTGVATGNRLTRTATPQPTELPAGSYDLVITAPGRVNAVMTGVPVVASAITNLNSASAPLVTPPSGASYAAKGTITVTVTPTATDAHVQALQPVASGPTIQAAIVNADVATGAYSATLPASAPALVAYSASAVSYSFVSAASGAGAYTLSATVTGFAAPKTANITITNADVTADFAFP